MIYLLIDNCSLRDLIDNLGYSKYLTELQNLISSNRVAFITHELIKEEWEKHKSTFRKKKEKKLLNYGKQANHPQGESNVSLPSTSLINTTHLQEQIEQIDSFLKNAYATLEMPQVIKNEFADRFRKKVAPFHNKKDSLNDWEIFGSFCHYCEMNGIKDLYFLSANCSDFADENEPNKKIHPTLKARFHKTKIKYFKDYRDFFNEILDVNSISKDLIHYTLIPNTKFTRKSTFKKTVLESLNHLYNDLYNEISFVPTHILIKYYPFSSSIDSHAYYGNFTVHYVTEEMINFFDNITIQNEKDINFKDESLINFVKDYKEKCEFILRRLTYNLVFHITGEDTRKRVCTHYFYTQECECSRCSYNKFEFYKSLKDLKSEQIEYKEKLKQAYIHYQLGNYESSNTIYDQIVETAIEKNKFITYFIAKYNQKQLSNFLNNFLINDPINRDLVYKLSLIDPIEEAVKLKTHTDYNLLIFIAQEDFFSNGLQHINQVVTKIIDHYESQLNGGWSSNQHIWELIEHFVKLECFLNSNYIIYDCYSNFKTLFEKVTEGIFASHAMANSQPERFENFDDYWLSKFITYGDRKVIIKFFDRFNLKSLEYNSKGKKKESILTLFKNIVSNIANSPDITSMHLDKSNRYFRIKSDQLFANVLTMASLLKLKDPILYGFANILLSYLIKLPKLNNSAFESMNYFLEKKGGLLPQKMKYDFLNCFIKCSNRHDNMLQTALQCFDDNTLLEILDEDFNYILNLSLNTCNQCHQRHSIELLTSLFAKVDQVKKETITQQVSEALTKEFNFEIYYMCSLCDIIKFDIKRLHSLVADYTVNDNRITLRTIFTRSIDFEDSYLDQIINLCFKFDVDTTSIEFKKLSAIHPYYEWVLNMQDYNYENFSAEWVLLYRTIFYYKAMEKSTNLKSALKQYLSSQFHLGIERVLLRITNFID